MDLDRLRSAWQSQASAQPGQEPSVTATSVMARCRKFDRDIFWRDALEVGVAVPLVVAWLVGAHVVGNIRWIWYLSAAFLAWIAVFFVVDRRQRAKPVPTAPIQAHIEHALLHVEHQIGLLREVVAWYLFPGLLATLLPGLEIAVHIPLSRKPFATLIVLVSIMYPAIYWLNQWAVRKRLAPLKQELEQALADLAEGVPEYKSREARPIVQQHRFMFGVLSVLVVLAVIATFQLVRSSAGDVRTSPCWPTSDEARKALGHLRAPSPHDLSISKARYGADGAWVDVTAALQKKIQHGTLSMSVGNNLVEKDPAFGRTKRLELEYVADGQSESLSLPEGAFLEVPDFVAPIATEKDLLDFVRQCPAQVGLYGINLANGRSVEYQPDQPACMASIVKLFTLLEVLNQARAGHLKLTDALTIKGKGSTVDNALDLMIGQSDNDATQALTELVGYDKVNALPQALGMAGVSTDILPKPGVLGEVLDRRVRGLRAVPAESLLPQHATARGMARYFELMHQGKLLSPELSADVRARLERHPRGFVPHAPAGAKVVGKGGSLSWTRPPMPEYNMIGWALYVTTDNAPIAFCLWFEWFPETLSRGERDRWCFEVSDGIVRVLQ